MVKLLSVIFFCAGAFIALSAFIPRVRLHWARTRIPCGFLGRLGAGSFFISVGVRFFLSDSLPGELPHLARVRSLRWLGNGFPWDGTRQTESQTCRHDAGVADAPHLEKWRRSPCITIGLHWTRR